MPKSRAPTDKFTKYLKYFVKYNFVFTILFFKLRIGFNNVQCTM